MSSDQNDGLLGRIALHYKLISLEQLNEATRRQTRIPGMKIGDLLIELGFVGRDQLKQLLQAQERYLQRLEAKNASDGGSVAPPAQQPTPVEVAATPPQTMVPPPAKKESAAVADSDWEPRPEVDPRNVAWLHQVLARSIKEGASDIHIHSGAPIKLRRCFDLVDLSDEVFPADRAESVLTSIMTDDEYRRFKEHYEIDFSYAVADLGRFRINIYHQQRGTSGVFHFVPPTLPTLESLRVPTSLAKLTNYHNGLVLVTGPCGSGKTSTMAALVNILNQERSDHILSIEDPIEYVHPAKQCIVSQRQVGPHTESFPRALRAALREDPDVICIGELRDRETISLALSAAETGHLVIGTLHTNSSIRTINRIIGVYPPSQQPQVQTMLSESLRSVISQRLIPETDGKGLAVAMEILMVNKAVGTLIRENRTFQIQSSLQTGAAHGMKLLDVSLQELVSAGRITKEAAAANAEDRRLFE